MIKPTTIRVYEDPSSKDVHITVTIDQENGSTQLSKTLHRDLNVWGRLGKARTISMEIEDMVREAIEETEEE